MSSWGNTHTLCLRVAENKTHKLHKNSFPETKKKRCESFCRLGCDDKMALSEFFTRKALPDRMFHKLTGYISHVHQGISLYETLGRGEEPSKKQNMIGRMVSFDAPQHLVLPATHKTILRIVAPQQSGGVA